ncbi:non-ribosomal peptide synthase/polyketide synthase [Pedobacter sp. WC2423]|uniref:non-ribosomal peptide synthase/polyketide synthase n=1 Tax=Pedobacter sp. WC2423 TaxID=3234142 RepID=UPI00346726CC
MIDHNIENKLLSDYWINKIKDRKTIRKAHTFSSHTTVISGKKLAYLNKVTGERVIAEYTVLLAIYALLLKRYFAEFDGMVFSIDQQPVLLAVYPAQEITIREFLSQIKNEVLEVNLNAKYEVNVLQKSDIDFAALTHFGLVYGAETSAPLPFLLKIWKENGDLHLELEYAGSFVHTELAKHFLHNYQLWIEQLEEYINTTGIPVLNEAEKHHILYDFNDTARDFPRDKTIVDLFEAQVLKSPEAIALSFEGQTLTYAVLNAKANQLARYLLDHYTIAADDVVGMLLPKSANALITILAVLKSGAAYLPIDVDYPEERINYIIADSGITILIKEEIAVAQYDSSNLCRTIAPADLAYVIYTSGSTGRPKGVMITHSSNVNMSLDQIRLFDITLKDKVVWFASIAFDASVSEIMMALYSGATLVIPGEDVLKEHHTFGSFLKQNAATVVTFPPSYLDLLSDEDISGLRCIISAGEAAHLQRAVTIAKTIAYYNAYGPTECAVCVSVYQVSANDQIIPIGKPIANLRVYILDDYLRPVPVGVTGKLYVAGPGVARGYLHNDALTAEKFVPDLLGDGKMYDTGDTARWLADGNIEFLGRIDEQVKLHGFRIEPGEIEHELLRLDNTLQQVVVAVKQDVLVAYYVSAAAVDKALLREGLLTILPGYMVPSFFVRLKALPVTPNGKTDRKALPDVQEDDVIHKLYAKPENELEQNIAAIWERILGIERVGVMDNLFELGGNSLLISRVAAAIRTTLQVDVPLKQMFLHPTVRSLSNYLSLQDKLVSLPAIERQERPARLPLSFSQERLWLVHQIEGSSHYQIPVVLQLQGEIDRTLLACAFAALLNRHEVLRTVIVDSFQVILPAGQWKMSDYKGSLEEFLAMPFDLSTDHLLRAGLFEGNVLAIVFHHIAVDGWSMPILAAELTELYLAAKETREAVLTPLALQYADYAIWQRGHLNGEYWESKIKDMSLLELPLDFARPAVKSIQGASLFFSVNQQQTQLLKKLADREQVTLFMTLLTVFKILLYRYTGQEDLSIGSPVANRAQDEVAPLIGFFVNVLLLRNDLSGNPGFKELLARVKESTLEALAHQDIPCNAPLLSVLFVFQNNEQVKDYRIGDVDFNIVPVEQRLSKLDLTFSITETAEGLDVSMQYNTDLFLPETMMRMKEHFNLLLSAVVADPETRIGELNMLLAEDEFTVNRVPYPKELTLVDIFETQATRTPDAVALIYAEKSITYKEIEERSNQLAHELVKHGVSKNSMVLLCLDGALEMVLTGILGILKSGAAYVPLDPDYPQERFDFIVNDTNAHFVVTDRSCEALLDSAKLHVILMDETSAEPGTRLVTDLTAGDLLYVIYTSGSTGQPKGVMITHQNVTDYLYGLFATVDMSLNRSFALMSTISTDLGNTVLFGSLFSGGTLHLFAKETLRTPAVLHAYFEQYAIDCIKIVPSYWKSLQDAGRYLLPQRMIIFGGEELPQVLLQHITSIKVLNHYGPTETTIGKLLFQVKPLNDYRIVPIGQPFSNTDIYIVDQNFALCPIGVAGELLIGGDGIARGYLNLPALTAEKFIVNPFAEGRLYRTGDLVSRLADGNIVFKGRIDEQVKIRGYRIEPGEIASVLNQVVRQSVVVVKEDAGGNKRLIAYVVPDGEFDTGFLQHHLSSKLPAYMVPSQIVELKALPVTSNGKIDKKALPEVTFTASNYVAARNGAEEILVNIWKELLHLERVGIHDNFFELGGDSIISIQVVSRANRYGLALSPRHIFEYQTIGSLALHLQEINLENTAEQGHLTGEAALLPIQRWFLESNFTDKSHYNQSQLLKIDKKISTTAIKSAVDALVAQHDALRFSYKEENGTWKQFYTEAKNVFDIHGGGDITALCNAAQRSLDITEGRLIKVLLIQTPEEDVYNRLFFVIHHLAVDGVSWRILLEQFQEWVMADHIVPGLKTSSYREWAAILQQYEAAEYWKGMAEQYVALPVDKTTDMVITAADRQTYRVVLNKELTHALLAEVNKAYHTEINDILLTALAKVLFDWTGAARSVIGMEGHGRADINPNVDTSRTVGWFTTIYPLLLEIEEGLSSGELISGVKEQLRTVPDKGLGYGLLGLKSKWDIVFNYLGQTDHVAKLIMLADEDKGDDISPAFPFDRKLDVRGIIVADVLVLDWIYAPQQYYPETIVTLATAYIDQLTQLIVHCKTHGRREFTPSDFGLAPEVGYKELAAFCATKNISAVYRLSPLQNGMLFHHLYDEAAKSYRQQLQVDFNCTIDVIAFEASWNYLLTRFSVLRSAFVAGELAVPVQCVYEQVSVPFKVLDMNAAEADSFIKADLELGFDFEVAPLMRITLIRLAPSSYKMVWTHHHIILDGWSNSVLLAEFKQAYAAFASGNFPVAKEEDRYADYVKYIAKTDAAVAEEAWKAYMSGFREKTLLPFARKVADHERSKDEGRVAHRLFEINAQAIKRFCQRHQLTVNTFVQGVWSLLLSSYTASPDITFGVVVSGRPFDLQHAEQRVGLYINTIPLRTVLGEQQDTVLWLKELQSAHMHSRQYQYTALSEIQHWIGINGDLFDSILVFENYPDSDAEEDLLPIAQLAMNEQTNYPLTITAVEKDNQLKFNFSYNTDLLDSSAIEMIIGHFQHVVPQLLHQKNLAAVQLVTPAEVEQLLVDFNLTETAYPAEQTIVDLFEEQVAKTPDDIALIFAEEKLTYKALDDRANRLAQYLRAACAVERDELVGIMMDNSVWAVVAVLGVLKAGAAYVPIDSHYPADRKAYLIKDTALKVLITASSTVLDSIAPEVEVLVIDRQFDDFELAADYKRDYKIMPNHVAYVIYTSGSTGKPKGVVVGHESLYNYSLHAMGNYTVDGNKTGSYIHMPLTFDASVTALYIPLLQGKQIVISTGGGTDIFNDPNFVRYAPYDFIKLTPAHLIVLKNILDAQLLPGLTHKYVLGGEALKSGDVQHWTDSGIRVEIINEYGPTEATVGCSTYSFFTAEPVAFTDVPIGKPIANTKLYLLDTSGNLAPVGVPAELYIGGVGLAKGYLQLPALTNERFTKGDYGRLYKTGDLAKWLPDGNLVYLGRLDDQVKINGYRIEPGEITAVLNSCEQVSQGIVILKDKRLIAYIVPEGVFDKDFIQAYLKSHLPEYMLPSLLLELPEMPLTHNGKIDKQALPDVVPVNFYVAPLKDTERKLAGIWQELLHVARIGIDDDFFELGGDSIVSIQVVSRCSKLGLHLHPRDLFEYRTIRLLATRMDNNNDNMVAEQGLLTGQAVLLPIQQWFFELPYAHPAHYNQSQLLNIDKSVSAAVVNTAVKALVAQHDALRFIYQDGQQWYGTAEGIVEVHESAEITVLCNAAQRELDLTTGSLIKVLLIQTPAADAYNRLFIVIHHLVVDGVSWRILLEQLDNLLNGETLGAKSTSYRAWGNALQQYAASKVITAQQTYWQNVIGAYQPLAIKNTASRKSFVLKLDSTYTRALLQEVHQVYHTEINDILLAALSQTLFTETGAVDTVIGMEGHGREYISRDLDTSATLGWFTTVYPVLLSAAPGIASGDLIKQVKEQLRAVPQNGIGYGLLRYLHPSASVRDSLKAGQWDVLFNYLGQSDNVLNSALLHAASEETGDSVAADFSFSPMLDISAIIREGELNLRFSSTADADFIQALAASFLANLKLLITHCKQAETRELTPSDCGLAPEVGYKELSAFLADRNITEVYRITPLQKGMLFHYLYDQSTAYLEQFQLDFTAGVSIDAFTASWNYILSNHSVLRSSFTADAFSIPVQCVHPEVSMPITLLDYSGLEGDVQAAALHVFFTDDFQQGFDLDVPPLMRITLIKLSSSSYKMIWTRYHILLDGWSNSVLIAEFLEAYEAFAKGAVPAVKEEDKYSDFIKYIGQADHFAAEDFWKHYLHRLNDKTMLPFVGNVAEHSRNTGDGKVAHSYLRTGRAVTEEMKQFCQQHQLTPTTLLQGVWALLLSRYTGNMAVVFGMVVSGRPVDLLNAEQRIGLYINNLPLHSVVEGVVIDWLHMIQREHTDARQYQYTALNEIQHWINVKGDLFDTVMVFDNYPKAKYEANAHALKVDGMRLTERRNYLLSLSVSLKEELVIDFSYNSDLLELYYAEMIKGHFEQVLQQLINHPTRMVSAIDLLTAEEQLGLNATAVDYPLDKTMVDLFEEQVAKTPGNIAVIFAGEELTYRELDDRANRLAHYLRVTYSLQANDLTGIMMDRSVWSIVAILGVLKAGAAYVPIDINYPLERKSYIIRDTALKVLIIEWSSMMELMELDVPVLAIDIQFDDFEEFSSRERDYVISPDDLAYVIYTSGSTGKPKGVTIRHASNVNMSLDQLLKFDITTTDRILQFASLSFDASVSEIFMAFYAGATLVLIAEPIIADGDKFLDYTKKHGVSVITFPPVYLRTLDRNKLNFLRVIITAGEAAIVSDALYYSGICAYYNAYGPTECAVCVSTYKVDPNRIYKGQIPIGKPIANMKMYIMDNEMQLLPVGVEGDLYVSGRGLAKEYLHLPELTAEKFVLYNAERLYKTGDKARRLPDDHIEFLGRADEQVKIRGYRIELDEITSVLNLIVPGIVVAKEDSLGNKRLIAYMVADKNEEREDIIQHLKAQLPDYMIPALFMMLDSLPLTTNGKVDKKALPDPDAVSLLTNAYEAPRDETEQQLAVIWEELLGLGRVGIYDSFFELGGDSIICIQLVSRANKHGFTLQPQDVFEYQTIAALAARLKENAVVNVAEQGLLTGEAGLLPIQRWFLDTEYDNKSHYNQSHLLSIDKGITALQVTTIMQALVARHDALRFRYTQREGGWIQEYSDAAGVVEVYEGGDITELCNEAQRGLAIGEGKVIKVLLIKTPESEACNRLFMVIHHLVVDGVSWRILLEQFQEGLKQPVAALGAKSSSFREWVNALNVYAEQDEVTAQLAFWQDIADAYSPLPVDRDAEKIVWADRLTHTITLSKELTRLLLTDANRAYNTEINDILLTALISTLNEWSGSSSAVIGMEGHGREYIAAELDTSSTVGWFTNVYPLLLTTAADLSSGDLIMSVKEQLRQVPHKGMGYGLLRYKTTLHAKWDVVFNYLGQTDNVLAGSEFLHAAAEHPGNNIGGTYPAGTKIDINSVVTEGMLIINWGYSEKQYEQATIAKLSTAFIDHLSTLIGHCVHQEKQATPSDYGLSPEVNYKELSRFLAGKQLSDIYRLSPLQKGMLFHHLYDSNGKAYMEQMRLDLPHGLDIGAFEKAWNYIIQHHSILRTGFVADELSIPVQCVHEDVRLPLSVLDYTEVEDKEAAVKQFLAADLERGFDFKTPPLMRITLIKLGASSYKMIWTHYHIILDGWSNAVLISSFLQTYAAYFRGRTPAAIPVDNYGDYIRYIGKSDHYTAQLFWKEYLAGYTEKSFLPFASNVVEIERNKGGKIAHQRLVVEAGLVTAVKRYCQQHQLTVNTLVQGIWSLLLSKYTGNNGVAFGVVVSGRPADLADAEHRIGLYINNLPLYTIVPDEQLTSDWLLTIQKEHTRAREYQYTTLNEIQQWIGIKGDLFDTILVYENYPKMDAEEEVLQVGDLTVEEQTNYLLTLTAVEQQDSLRFDFAYNSDLLDGYYAEMIKGHFEQVLGQVIANPPVMEIEILTADEHAQLVNEFNDTAVNYDIAETIVSLFEAQVRKTPNLKAFVFEAEELTYRELNERVNQLARYLISKGVGEGQLVGICIDRSVDMMVGLLGILKSGAAYVPIDPTYPINRINYMLEDSQVSTLLVNKDTAALITAGAVPFVLSLSDRLLLDGEDPGNPVTPLAASSLAYIIYTSGSTGKPKGVMISHRNVVNLFTGLYQRFAFDGPQNWLAVTSISFDISVVELFWTLINGNKVVMLPDRPLPLTAKVNMDFSLFNFAAQEAITAVESEEAFRQAGAMGANLLTHLLGKTNEELKDRIAVYRASLAAHGFDPEQGKVALMLHAFIGDDVQQVKETVKEPFKNYLRHSIDLLRPVADQAGLSLERDLDLILEISFERYFSTSGLFGTPESCLARIGELHAIGVNEVACLIDFGVDTAITLAHLSHLKKLQDLVKQTAAQQKLLARRMENVGSPEEIILQQGITHLQCTPSFTKELLSNPVGQHALKQLKTLMIGGETLPVALTKELFTYYKGVIYNMYGPTETTIYSTIKAITPADKISIGTPVANTQVYVLGRGKELLPVGVAGEIYIAGDGISRGYLYKQLLTEEKFTSLPFGKNGKLYRTGDLGRWLPDGELECLGRLDDQVKVRGHRIEIGEIESVISELPEVRECVVVKKEDALGNTMLVGYIVPGEGFDQSAVSAYIKLRLPAYMAPALLLTLDKLPLTPNGKIDKKALPAAEHIELLAGNYVAPRNDTEEKLIKIWTNLLKIKRISITDSFFELGGNSLLAIQIIAAVGNEMGVQITIKDLFENPVVEALAAVIGGKEQHVVNRLMKAPALKTYPITSIQKAYWLASQQENVAISYNITLGWQVEGEIDQLKLQEAFGLLLQRHDILRSVINYDENGELSLLVQDTMDGFMAAYGDDEPMHLLAEENRFVFDFEQGPLLRIRMLRNTDGTCFIFFNTHHILVDPFSLKLIFVELLALYKGDVLPAVGYTFKDYAYSLSITADDRMQQETFWRSYLQDRIPEVHFPAARQNVALRNEANVLTLQVTDQVLLQRLRSYNREQQGTMFIMLLTLVNVVVYMETGQQDISFGSPVNGRDSEALKNIVGLFLNTVIIRTTITGDPTFEDLYTKVKASVIAVLAHSAFPYLDVADIDTGRGEFNIGFNLNPTDLNMADISYPDLDFIPLKPEGHFVKADLWFDITEWEEKLTISLSYRKDRFDDAYIQSLIAQLERLLKYCLSDKDATLSRLKATLVAEQVNQVQRKNLSKLKKQINS